MSNDLPVCETNGVDCVRGDEETNLIVQVVAELPEPLVRETGERLFDRFQIDSNPLNVVTIGQGEKVSETRLVDLHFVLEFLQEWNALQIVLLRRRAQE